MNADMKIETLFAALTHRYGRPEMKDGQSMQAVFDSWCVSVGAYSQDDIMAALRSWTQVAKYEKWPTEAQFLEMLRTNVMARPERAGARMDMGWKEAEQDVGAWYRREILGPSPTGWFPFTVEEAVVAFVASKAISGSRETFAQSLTRLWLKGSIQNEWDRFKTDWIARANAGKANYHDRVAEKGVRYANTTKAGA